ncbi:MAG: flavodoxin family protein [Chloroflexota bacterium]|nr:flavodoxin family protein [Chloroflexota bacterium]
MPVHFLGENHNKEGNPVANSIAFVLGSPRKKGNTRGIAAVTMEVARENDSEVDVVDVTELDFKKPGCVGCQKCQQSKEFACSIGDQLGQTVATLPKYDVIVMATPLYWWGYPAQIKMFVDRMYSLTKFTDSDEIQTVLAGKTLALLATALGPVENNLELLEQQWKNAADILQCPFMSCMFPNTPLQGGDLVKDSDAIEKAKEFGRLLSSVK